MEAWTDTSVQAVDFVPAVAARRPSKRRYGMRKRARLLGGLFSGRKWDSSCRSSGFDPLPEL